MPLLTPASWMAADQPSPEGQAENGLHVLGRLRWKERTWINLSHDIEINSI